MSELNITNIPAPRVPFVDERTGLMAREWYRFFLNMFVLTGSGSNATTLDELQLGPPSQPVSNAGSGTVTNVSVVSANGFAGTVATDTTTPAITLSTTVTGVLKGNGTAISAAVANVDYVPLSTVLTKTADKAAAYYEATRLAGFQEEEALRFFGRPPKLTRDTENLLTPLPTDEAKQLMVQRVELLSRDIAALKE